MPAKTNSTDTGVDNVRYLIIKGRRWRRSDPGIPESLRSELVKELMAARRAVGQSKREGDTKAEQSRARVQDAKIALGERGRAWWLPQESEALQKRLRSSIRTLLRKRGPGKTICPSDAARIAGGTDWRGAMPQAKDAAWVLADEGWLEIVQKGEPVKRSASGPIRLRRKTDQTEIQQFS